MTTNRIAMWTLVAGLAAGAAYGQSDPYGPPGSQGQPGQYGQQDRARLRAVRRRLVRVGQLVRTPVERRLRSDDGRPGYDGHDDYGDYGRAPGVDVGFFYDELSPYGEWVRHPYYGWVWFPRHVRAGWRPYSVGRWVESDYGWTWVSYEPFGWATYHYGRWAWDRYVGWLWVPGTDWGPAWVAWQQGNGYIGWAPLPPAVGFDLRVGIQLGGFNLSFGIAPRNYAFVDERRFLDTRIGGYIVPEARNVTIIHNTTNITNYTVVDNRVINHGVPVERVERVTGRRAQRLRVAAQTSSRATSVERDVVRIYRPAETKLESVKVAKRNNAGLRRQAAKGRSKSSAGSARRRRIVRPRPPSRASRTARCRLRSLRAPNRRRRRSTNGSSCASRRSCSRTSRRSSARWNRCSGRRRRRERARASSQEATKSAEKGRRGHPRPARRTYKKRHAAELEEQKVLRERTAEQLKNRQQIQRQAAEASAEKAKGQGQGAGRAAQAGREGEGSGQGAGRAAQAEREGEAGQGEEGQGEGRAGEEQEESERGPEAAAVVLNRRHHHGPADRADSRSPARSLSLPGRRVLGCNGRRARGFRRQPSCRERPADRGPRAWRGRARRRRAAPRSCRRRPDRGRWRGRSKS